MLNANSDEELSKNLADFFKNNVNIEDSTEILNLPPNALRGIDNISKDILFENNIKTIEALANLSLETPPIIKKLSENVLIKWIKISKFLKKVVLKQIKKEKKLLMVGLDNGGKTSLLAILQNKFSLIKDNLPTRGVSREEINFFGYPIISWDLGGQIQYREKMYFEKPELYFAGANILIYVVDIQDTDRFNESAEYFQKVIEILDNLNENIPIFIVLNKFDPDIAKNTVWKYNVKELKQKFDKILEKFDGFPHDYLETSVFNKEAVINMFSSGVKRISDTSDIIENILQEYGNNINAKALSLISIEGLVFGSYFTEKHYEEILINTGLILLALENFYESKGLTPEKRLRQELSSNKIAIRGERLFAYGASKSPVYLWLLSDQTEMLDDVLEYLENELMPLVKLFV